MLERIDYQAAALAAKTERLKLLKAQYELYLMRYYGPHAGLPIYTIPSPPPTTKMEFTNANLYPKTTYMPQNERQFSSVSPTYVPTRRYEIDSNHLNDVPPNNKYLEDDYQPIDPDKNQNRSNIVISPSLLLDNHVRGYSPERNLQPDVTTYSPISSPAIRINTLVSTSPATIPSLTLTVPSQSPVIQKTTSIAPATQFNSSLINNFIAPVENNKHIDDNAFINNNTDKTYLKKVEHEERLNPSKAEVIDINNPVINTEDIMNDNGTTKNDINLIKTNKIDESPVDEIPPSSYRTSISHTTTVSEKTLVTNQIDDITKPIVKKIHQVWEKVVDEKQDNILGITNKKCDETVQGEERGGVERKSFIENSDDDVLGAEASRVKVIESMYKEISKIGPKINTTTDDILQPGYERELNQKIEKLYVDENKTINDDTALQDDAESDAESFSKEKENDEEVQDEDKLHDNINVDENQESKEKSEYNQFTAEELDRTGEIENVVYPTAEVNYDSNYQGYSVNSNVYPIDGTDVTQDANYGQQFQGSNSNEYQQPQQYDQYQQPQDYQTDPELYQQNMQQYENQQYQQISEGYPQEYQATADEYQQDYQNTPEGGYPQEYQLNSDYQQEFQPAAEGYQQDFNTTNGTYPENYQQGYVQDYQPNPEDYQQGYQEQQYTEQQYISEEQTQQPSNQEYYNEEQFNESYQQDPNYQNEKEDVPNPNQYYTEQPGENYYADDSQLPQQQQLPLMEHNIQDTSQMGSPEVVAELVPEVTEDLSSPALTENPVVIDSVAEGLIEQSDLSTSDDKPVQKPPETQPKKKRVNFLDSDTSESLAPIADDKMAQPQSDSDFDFSTSK